MKYQFITRSAAAFILCTSVLIAAAEDSSQTNGSGDGAKLSSSQNEQQNTTDKTALLLYRKIFKQKRAQQMSAAGDILKLKDYAKTYKMVDVLLGKLFQARECKEKIDVDHQDEIRSCKIHFLNKVLGYLVLLDAKIKLMESGYIPGGNFPKEQQQLDALANVLENTAFFGDILLRLPDVTHKVYRRFKEWELLAKWSISFCNETQVYDEMDTTLLNLMAQELELVPWDPNYINPYRLQEQLMQKAREEVSSLKKNSNKKKKEKTKKKRGPRLSGHTEL